MANIRVRLSDLEAKLLREILKTVSTLDSGTLERAHRLPAEKVRSRCLDVVGRIDDELDLLDRGSESVPTR